MFLFAMNQIRSSSDFGRLHFRVDVHGGRVTYALRARAVPTCKLGQSFDSDVTCAE